MQFSKIVSFMALAAASVAQAEEVKQLFYLKGPKSMFDAAFQAHPELDVWKIQNTGDDMVAADIYALPSVIEQVIPQNNTILGVNVEESDINVAQQIEDERASTQACKSRTVGYLNNVKEGNYVENAFFDCWRTYEEAFEFVDKLVGENSKFITKFAKVSSTVEGRDIPAYKISTGSGRSAIYVQGMLHAREWHAGSTALFTMARFLDLLRADDAALKSLFEKYDFYFTPIVNLDGFKYTWEKDRMWRKNRRPISSGWGGATGVDLNRNWGPQEFFGKGGDRPSSDTYPGPNMLSEPESKGIFDFLKSIPKLKGAIDIHTYSALVLRPYGNQNKEPAEPWGSRMRTLGNNVRDALQRGGNGPTYTSQTAQQLYYAYGTFQDSMFMEFNIPSITFELEGRSFVQPESAIRPVGARIAEGVRQFASDMETYYAN